MTKKDKWIMLEEGQKVSINMLIELLKQAKEEFGGDTEVQVSGCYGSTGEIYGVGKWDITSWYKGVYLQTDLCSG